MTKAAAIYEFWASFGLVAYETNTVPTGDDAPEFPYLTYSFVVGSFGTDVAADVSVWYRDSSPVECNAKTEEIVQRIGEGGVPIKCDDGTIWIKLGDPKYQPMSDPSDDMIRRNYINIVLQYLTQH